MNLQQHICLEWAQKDLTLAAYRIKAALQRVLGSQEHGALPQGGVDLIEDLQAMLATGKRLDGEFEKILLTVLRGSGGNQAHPIIAAAKADYPDRQKLAVHFEAICREWPGHYRVGSDASFNNFVADIRQCVEGTVPA